VRTERRALTSGRTIDHGPGVLLLAELGFLAPGQFAPDKGGSPSGLQPATGAIDSPLAIGPPPVVLFPKSTGGGRSHSIK
jgi:hypothetical protein